MSPSPDGLAGPAPVPDDVALDLAAWGLVSALGFLVLSVGYRLVTPASPALPLLLTVAATVGLAGAASVLVARRVGLFGTGGSATADDVRENRRV